MARKIRIAGVSLILIIIIAGIVAVSVVSSRTVGDVKSFEVTAVRADSAAFSWSRVASADGYFVFAKTTKDESYKKIATIKDSKATGYTAKKLNPCTEYLFYVSAYKMTGDNIFESKNPSSVQLCTYPAKQQLVADSSVPGELELSWVADENSAGYEIQYSKGKKLSSPETITIKKASADKKIIQKLDEGEFYSVRVRTYRYSNETKLIGSWSDTVSVEIVKQITSDNIDPTKPMVALTFDDGPGYNSASDKILDVLEKYHVSATFFMVGKNASDHPDNLKRKIELGCEIGNHTYDHNHYGKNVTPSDIKKASDAIYKACGQYPTAFRSPGGNTTQTILSECKAEKMPLYYWSLDTEDWKSRNADKVYNAVMNHISDGDIVLMHEIYSSTADAVARIVPDLIKKGYQIVTCQQLIAAKSGNNPMVGQQYVDADTINNKTS